MLVKDLYHECGQTLTNIEKITGIATSTLHDYTTGKTYNSGGLSVDVIEPMIFDSLPILDDSFDIELSKGVKNLEAAKKLPKERRVLVIPDIHIPAEHSSALNHCTRIRDKYDCNVFISVGDLVDSHAMSYHESDVDLPSAGWELRLVKQRLAYWHDEFNGLTIISSNHGDLPARKLNTAGVPNEWLRSQEKVYNTPTWSFVQEVMLDNTLYIHGIGMKNDLRSCKSGMNTVSGHTHSEANIIHNYGYHSMLWSMKVGALIDRNHAGMAYAYHGKPPALACGVVLENGTLPILEALDKESM